MVTPKPATPTPNATALAGNWLLYGSLPISSTIYPGTTLPNAMAVSIDVTGTAAIATARIQSHCQTGTPFGATFGNILTGTVASDGTFTLSTPSVSGLNLLTLTVSGTVPAPTATTWSGSYSFTANSSACPIADSGSFQAAPIHDVTGLYTGTTTVLPTGSVSVAANLQQGAVSSVSGATSTTASRQTLSGSIQITGFSCFTKGNISTGLMEGSTAEMSFLMEDGSTLNLTGYLLDADASKMSVPVMIVRDGKCAGLYTSLASPLVLQR